MALIKDVYNREFYSQLADVIKHNLEEFKKDQFIESVLSKAFESMEYKERMRYTTLILNQFMPREFKDAVKILIKLTDDLERKHFGNNLIAFMFLPDYVELYGIDDYKTSMNAFERITQFISCEFAIRPFIIKYGEPVIEQMFIWSKHPNLDVRRLSSEGCRPQLPWAMALPELKKDPQLILSILENLKEDPSEYVRRSVANNLNDIAKDNPQTVVDIAKRWIGKNTETDKLIKHACRTLFKKGNPEILKLYGLGSDNLKVNNLNIPKKEIKIGESVSFSFEMENTKNTAQLIRIEYMIYYMKTNGKQTPKVFKISERVLNAREKNLIERNHSFKLITTRKFHIGEHSVSIVLNGKEFQKDIFYLTNK